MLQINCNREHDYEYTKLSYYGETVINNIDSSSLMILYNGAMLFGIKQPE